jgi:N-acetylglucosaminyl-diphospho-decaprenol L-rhamnosyltransferase
MSRTAIVSVLRNSARVLPALLATIPPGTEAIFVDNLSEDDGPGIVRRSGFPLIESKANLGFGRGCNLGAAAASSEFLFFVNPDARLGEDCIARLEAAAR